VIRISDGTIERLKAWAEPLQDTADSALAKVLDVAEEARRLPRREGSTTVAKAAPKVGRRAVSRNKLPQKAFRQPLLEVLHGLGGSARVADLRPAMRKKMMSSFLPGDLERISTGEERWWNATGWERSNLVKEGYLRADSPRGTWTLSEKGAAHVERPVSKSPDAFVEHLLAMPEVGDDADFDQGRSGPRRVEL
jgi:hypothetical protein